MKLRLPTRLLLALILPALPLAELPAQGPASAPAADPKTIYDEGADGSQQIAQALVGAKAANKHVLLQFGANWCIWCHRLHHLCAADPSIASKIKADYVVVLVDVDKSHNAAVKAKYGAAMLGLPALAVLDADGKLLVTQNSGALEQGDHHDPAKVLAFLSTWAPKK